MSDVKQAILFNIVDRGWHAGDEQVLEVDEVLAIINHHLEGVVIVPEEPTKDMCRAFKNSFHRVEHGHYDHAIKAGIAAAIKEQS